MNESEIERQRIIVGRGGPEENWQPGTSRKKEPSQIHRAKESVKDKVHDVLNNK